MDNNTRHKWSDNELLVVCSICKLTENNDERIRILQLIFPNYPIFSIENIVNKYDNLLTNRLSCCCIN